MHFEVYVQLAFHDGPRGPRLTPRLRLIYGNKQLTLIHELQATLVVTLFHFVDVDLAQTAGFAHGKPSVQVVVSPGGACGNASQLQLNRGLPVYSVCRVRGG